MKIVFQKSGHLNGTVSVETAHGCHSSESVASCCVVGRTPGDTRYGLDRAELLRWRPFPVRFTATVETSIVRGENWSLLLLPRRISRVTRQCPRSGLKLRPVILPLPWRRAWP